MLTADDLGATGSITFLGKSLQVAPCITKRQSYWVVILMVALTSPVVFLEADSSLPLTRSEFGLTVTCQASSEEKCVSSVGVCQNTVKERICSVCSVYLPQ